LKSNKQTPKIDLLRILARRKLFTQPAGSEALGDGKFTDFSLQVPLRLCKLPLIEALSEVAKCIALKFLLQLTLTLSLSLSLLRRNANPSIAQLERCNNSFVIYRSREREKFSGIKIKAASKERSKVPTITTRK